VIDVGGRERSVALADVREALPRRRYHRLTAVELFLRGGRALLLDFAPDEPPLACFGAPPPPLADATARWLGGALSNFAYLLRLNALAGRSFDDPLQYPLLPALRGRDIAIPVAVMPIAEPELECFLGPSVLPPAFVDRALARLEPFASLNCAADAGKEVRATETDFEHCELPADFFFLPEAVGEPFAAVYDRRIELEGPTVSDRLHLWIDAVFGCLQGQPGLYHPYVLDTVWEQKPTRDQKDILAVMRVLGVNPSRLFDSPHPPKPPRTTARSVAMREVPVTSLAFASVAARELWLLDAHGRLFVCQVSPELPIVSETEVRLPTGARVAFAGGKLVICDRARITLIDRTGTVECDADVIVGDGDFFAALRNAVISIFDAVAFPAAPIRIALRDAAPLCIAVSDTFDLIAVACADAALRYFSLKGRPRASAETRRAGARRLKVTPAWGIVVVEFGRAFEVFSVNGEAIGECENVCEIVEWAVASSRADLDVVVFQDVKGEVVAFEAARPEKKAGIAVVHRPLRFMDYSKEDDLLVLVSTTGKVMLVTHPFEDIERTE
jgi:hypothetical protein